MSPTGITILTAFLNTVTVTLTGMWITIMVPEMVAGDLVQRGVRFQKSVNAGKYLMTSPRNKFRKVMKSNAALYSRTPQIRTHSTQQTCSSTLCWVRKESLLAASKLNSNKQNIWLSNHNSHQTLLYPHPGRKLHVKSLNVLKLGCQKVC